MNKLSVIIPARNEKYLEKTIRNILENARGDIEILAVLDGYIPDPQIITNDNRVIFIHNPESIGQRQSINKAARMATGKYIMKLDAHCAVDEGFDIKLAADCEYDWTIIPRMYNLDIETFQPKRHKVTDYMYIGWNEKNEMRALYYNGAERKKWHNRPDLIDDTMCCMGPCFFMHKDRFWELGGCDEGHGGWGQQGIEVALKAWLSGGSLKVNKKTWFAHWFRAGVGFPYHLSGKTVDEARKYSMDLWLHDKWPLQKRSFQWVIDKFNPPGWGDQTTTGLEELKDIHKDKICYIIGTGPSALTATELSFAPGCPIITINMIGQHIERFKINNPLYSMQKDGVTDRPEDVYRPARGTLLVSKHESADLYQDYSPRYIFNAEVLHRTKYGYQEFSANCALRIAQIFGCKKIILIGFDAYFGDTENMYFKDKKLSNRYERQLVRMKELIKKDNLGVEWIKP